MKALDTALEEVFDLGYVDDTKDKEIETRDAEITYLKTKLAESENIVSSMKMEIEMWQKCYGRCMDMLVETKVNADVQRRMPVVEQKVVEQPVEKKPEPPKEPEQSPVEEPEELVEINTCTVEDLKRCGCSPTVIENIINNRPYMRLDELRIVSGVTTVGYGLLKRKLCCVPVKVETEEPKVVVEETPVVEEPVVEPESPEEPEALEKVDINTATIKEMMNHLGVGSFYAAKISSHRNKNGKFVSLEELRMVEDLPKNFYERYAHLCTIGESEPVVEEVIEEPEQKQGKLNINTASAQEIHDTLGLSMTVCYSITGCRARNGLYKSIEELRQVPRFAESHWEKYKDLITVGDPEPEQEEQESDKVNIDTASLRELMAVGFEKRAAALIVNERRKFGRFRSVDDLAEIPEIKGKVLRKLREKLEV
jgi:competence protein ComEA